MYSIQQNIYMYFKPYEKENSLQSDFELVFLEAWPGTCHLNLPVQVNKVLIITSSLIKKKRKTLYTMYCESDVELVFIEA